MASTRTGGAALPTVPVWHGGGGAQLSAPPATSTIVRSPAGGRSLAARERASDTGARPVGVSPLSAERIADGLAGVTGTAVRLSEQELPRSFAGTLLPYSRRPTGVPAGSARTARTIAPRAAASLVCPIAFDESSTMSSEERGLARSFVCAPAPGTSASSAAATSAPLRTRFPTPRCITRPASRAHPRPASRCAGGRPGGAFPRPSARVPRRSGDCGPAVPARRRRRPGARAGGAR